VEEGGEGFLGPALAGSMGDTKEKGQESGDVSKTGGEREENTGWSLDHSMVGVRGRGTWNGGGRRGGKITTKGAGGMGCRGNQQTRMRFCQEGGGRGHRYDGVGRVARENG